MGVQRKFTGPNILISVALAPMLLLVALVVWFLSYFRPSGHEHWGDGAILISVFFVAYPVTLLLTLAGFFWAHRRSRQFATDTPLTTRALGVGAILLLLLPWMWVGWLAISDRMK
jgi:hypothetical protein